MKKILLFAGLIAIGCRPITTTEDTIISGKNTSLIADSTGRLTPREEESGIYQAAETILTDLINTKLEVSFDWNNAQLIGKETLTAKPHFYASNQLVLDAKGMEIKSVQTVNGTPLTFKYESDELTITLDRTYNRSENFTVVISYISKPDERVIGGSTAITSDKGLYFINPKGTNPSKMPQIWTQGETESSSVWFPTIDAPNSKTKQETYITVADKYTTLSNGKLISSTKNADGTRTDYWKQDLPHAPYLFMMGVGAFKVVKDSYKRQNGSTMEVNYYVEPEWEPYAKNIFGETPEMIRYFSSLLGVEYPWDKYAQIVVREYVSGAMENTGAVVFGDYAYKTDRELLDANDQSTIAHELFHHWFGDYVTCESWSNLSLNESFANYSQYLWDEHRFGRDEAEYQALIEADGYYQSAEQGGYHQLIWFDYADREDMFDGHSYNKGGRILHMLRSYLGDDAFFTALQNYLKTNAFKPAEYTQLRLAFEDVSGEDLNWFFKQWYLDKGHPSLTVNYSVDSINHAVDVTVEQTQDAQFRLFKMPVDINVMDDLGEHVQRVWINDAINTYTFSYSGNLKNIIFDNQAMLLAKVTEQKDANWYVQQYYQGDHYIQRKNALQNGSKAKTAAAEKMVLDALNDPYWDIRATALASYGKLSPTTRAQVLEVAKKQAVTDSMPMVRATALSIIAANAPYEEAVKIMEERIKNDPSYTVITTALFLISKTDPKKAIAWSKPFENEFSSKMQSNLAMLYARIGTSEQFAYYQKILAGNILQGYDRLGSLNALKMYCSKQELATQRKALELFEQAASAEVSYVHYIREYIEFLQLELNKKIDQYSAEENAATNSNAKDIAKGKRTDAEALWKEYEQLKEKLNEMK